MSATNLGLVASLQLFTNAQTEEAATSSAFFNEFKTTYQTHLPDNTSPLSAPPKPGSTLPAVRIRRGRSHDAPPPFRRYRH
mgnify:CR=1 FL=1